MVIRFRTEDGPVVSGSWNDAHSGASVSMKTYENTCEDNVAGGDGWPLEIIKARLESGRATTSGISINSTPSNARELESFSCTYWRNPRGSFANHLSIAGKPSSGALAAQLLAETNPSRSAVDLPIFFAELRELPDLIKSAGNSIIRKIASGNLKYQFALKPLISDLSTLLDFQKEFSKREKELTALSSSGLRRTRTLWTSSSSNISTNVSFNSSPSWCLVRGTNHRVTKMKVWGFVKWSPTANAPKTPDEAASLARKAVLGLTIDPVTAWELIPWSWLVDWCSSAGDYLQSKRNLVGATPSTPLIMTLRSTETRLTITSDSTALFEGVEPVFIRETKERTSANASLSAYLPFFNKRQLSILGSISVLRSTRR